MAFSQSELLQKEVFLVETVESAAKESMTHLKAVCFLRPTSENIQHLKRVLSNPRFGEYHLCKAFDPESYVALVFGTLTIVIYFCLCLLFIFAADFSNVLKNSHIQILGDADEHEVVQQVQVFISSCYLLLPLRVACICSRLCLPCKWRVHVYM